MDDISINSQMPEVFWDYGSPSPNTWKRCQGSDLPHSGGKINYLKVSSRKKVVKKPRNIFKIDTKSLDKARSLIAQLQNRDNAEAGNSSLDQLFDQSGGQEDLASSLSGLPVTNGSGKNADADQPLPADFWSDDVFAEAEGEKQIDENKGCSASRTSTPLRNHPAKKSLNLKKRQLNSLLATEHSVKPSHLIDNAFKKATSSNQSTANETNDNKSDPSIDFLVTFGSLDKKKKLLSKSSAILDTEQNLNPSKPILKLTAPHADSANLTTPSKTDKRSDVSISEDILTQLIMDDSWTANCTASTNNAATSKTTEIPKLDSALTQLLMDDSWNDTIVKQSKNVTIKTSSNSEQTSVPCNIVKPLHPILINTCFPSSSSEELEDTFPVSPLSFQNIPRNAFRDGLRKANSCHATPVSNSAFPFNSKKSTTLKKAFVTRTDQKCTAAEIEEKRLRALQRKRLRTKV